MLKRKLSHTTVEMKLNPNTVQCPAESYSSNSTTFYTKTHVVVGLVFEE